MLLSVLVASHIEDASSLLEDQELHFIPSSVCCLWQHRRTRQGPGGMKEKEEYWTRSHGSNGKLGGFGQIV